VGRPRRASVRSRLKEGNIPGKAKSKERSKKSGKKRR
jgi:ribonuclease R